MSIVRIIAALVAGLVVGSLVNMGLVMLGGSVVAPPNGVDVTDPDSFSASMHLFQPKHFLFPFLAHALGTLAGALTAHLIAGSKRNMVAWIIGALFLTGGIAASIMIPAPVWFIVLDLVLAYLPMAYIAARIGWKLKPA